MAWEGRGAQRRRGAADWHNGEGDLRIDATVRWGRGRRRDGKGSASATAPPLEWTVVLDGVRREAAAARWGGGHTSATG
jgi:hypothetical protein